MKRISTLGARVILLCLTGLLLFAPLSLADGYNQGVTSEVLKKAATTANGKKIAFPVTDKAEVTAAMVSITPGAETGWHRHPMPVYAYVLSGRLSVSLEDGGLLSYAPGDVIIEVVEALHNGKNMGSDPVKLVVFYLGSEGVPLAIKEAPAEKDK